MEGLDPPVNPTSSVKLTDIRQRITETAQAGEEARRALGEMLVAKFADSFAERQEELTQTRVLVHRISTTNDRPVYLPARRVPPPMVELQRVEADKLRAAKLTRPSRSPYNAPVVMVPKKDGKIRFCVDYRALNDITVKDVYPMPRIDETLERLHGARWFSTLDLCSGYHQVPIHPADRKKTALWQASTTSSWSWSLACAMRRRLSSDSWTWCWEDCGGHGHWCTSTMSSYSQVHWSST
jgi:hypothetical protein